VTCRNHAPPRDNMANGANWRQVYQACGKGKMAGKPLIRIAVVESDPLRVVGFHALFDHESGFDLVSASLPDISVLQNIDLWLFQELESRSGGLPP
jgi:hypothetical protein